MEIARVILLLTGSIQGTKKQVLEYLQSFTKYDWLWKHNADSLYQEFMKTNPELDDYDREVRARMSACAANDGRRAFMTRLAYRLLHCSTHDS